MRSKSFAYNGPRQLNQTHKPRNFEPKTLSLIDREKTSRSIIFARSTRAGSRVAGLDRRSLESNYPFSAKYKSGPPASFEYQEGRSRDVVGKLLNLADRRNSKSITD